MHIAIETREDTMITQLCEYVMTRCRGVARGGAAGYICPRAPRYRGAKVQGRQNEAYKTFTRVNTIVDYVNYL